MTWREDLRRVTFNGKTFIGASFRGVPFFVESADRSGGRRTVVHTFPLRDDPFVEDLGRKARGFKVEGYVIGDDYLVQRDALMVALEDTAGPGELVHPYHGVRRAICSNLSTRDSRAEGGIATFSIDFDEAPAQAPVPVTVVNTVSVVAAKADAANAAAKAELSQKYVTSAVTAARDGRGSGSLPGFAFASAERAIKRASDALGSFVSPVVKVTQELAVFTGALRTITAEAASLARNPGGIVDAFTDTIRGLASTASAAPGALLGALVDTYSAELGAGPAPLTATRQRELDNHDALVGALRQVVAIEAARLSPTVPYPSIEDASAARNEVAGLLEEQASTTGDTAFPALVDLRSEVLRSVPGSTAFARIITVSRRVALPSLVLAHQLYGTVAQEADILARNDAPHPGFLAGDLQVLSDAG